MPWFAKNRITRSISTLCRSFPYIYFRNGYLSAAKSFNESDLDVRLNGKVYMITGANSGIGKCAAVELAKKGGEIHMVCRNQERAEAAKKDIINQSTNEVNDLIR